MRRFATGILAAGLFSAGLRAQVSFQRLSEASREPQNWLTYNGNLQGTHYSGLDLIKPANAAGLELKWVYQASSLQSFEATPLVVNGVMYTVEPPNNVVAIDTRTGRPFWIYRHPMPATTYVCCGDVNRGLAILDDTLFLGTLDAQLVALDASTGRRKWQTKVAEYTDGYGITVAPLVVKDKVIVGPAGGERGISGFLAAYDAKTGKEVWKFRTIPQPGEPGHETWAGDSWKTGGASVWVTGSYDPELNLVYWGIGNPGPDWNPSARRGDNLYSDCVIALDADTGRIRWYYQFTPNDEWDFDSVQVPVLADLPWKGQPRKLLLWGNRNGFFYALDRASGEFLSAKAFVKQTWNAGFDEKGRPFKAAGSSPSPTGTDVYPGVQGATNWYAPSFSPRTRLFYLSVWADYHTSFFTWDQKYERGKPFTGGEVVGPVTWRREPFITWDPSWGYGVVRALDPVTGERVWDYPMRDVTLAGILTTAGDVLFSGNREGYFFALDARTGKELWKRYLGGMVVASPITYMADGAQYVSVAAGHSLFTFALRK